MKNSFLSKKLLKGTQVSITESLKAKWMRILKKAREKMSILPSMEAYGRILYKDGNENKVKLDYD